MNQENSIEFFLRFVNEKHKNLQASLDSLVSHFIREDKTAKEKQIDLAYRYAKELESSMSSGDTPSWLSSLVAILNTAKHRPSSTSYHSLIQFLIKNLNNIKSHTWSFKDTNNLSFDFDSIFERYKSESRLSELFDEIINLLEKIKNSGDIDSIRMNSAIEKVTSTLKNNKNGSYFSIQSAWAFFKIFFKNYLFAQLEDIPALGNFINALKTTIAETDNEMHQLNSNIDKEMKSLVEHEIKPLEGKTNFQFLSYDNLGNITKDSTTKKLGKA